MDRHEREEVDLLLHVSPDAGAEGKVVVGEDVAAHPHIVDQLEIERLLHFGQRAVGETTVPVHATGRGQLNDVEALHAVSGLRPATEGAAGRGCGCLCLIGRLATPGRRPATPVAARFPGQLPRTPTAPGTRPPRCLPPGPRKGHRTARTGPPDVGRSLCRVTRAGT